jgi:hypothetical protein
MVEYISSHLFEPLSLCTSIYPSASPVQGLLEHFSSTLLAMTPFTIAFGKELSRGLISWRMCETRMGIPATQAEGPNSNAINPAIKSTSREQLDSDTKSNGGNKCTSLSSSEDENAAPNPETCRELSPELSPHEQQPLVALGRMEP